MAVRFTPLEDSVTTLGFALLLRDGLTFADSLAGIVTVSADAWSGQQKNGSGTFLFFGLPAGKLTLAVRSGADTPYYQPADITVTLPSGSANWPAFPDIALANRALPLWDPGQPAAYRAQFAQACLSPTVAYPFAAGATLVRGTVLHAGAPVAGVPVSDTAGATPGYVTGADGQFVLPFRQAPSLPSQITIRAHPPAGPDVDVQTTLRRGTTVSTQVNV